MATHYTYAAGRRKESVARVFLSPGEGKIRINKKEFERYFSNPKDRETILQAIEVAQKEGGYDFMITVKGGGITGQKEAIRLGVSRALALVDPEVRPLLKKMKYLSYDSRVVLPKRYGRKKHSKKPQFSKR